MINKILNYIRFLNTEPNCIVEWHYHMDNIGEGGGWRYPIFGFIPHDAQQFKYTWSKSYLTNGKPPEFYIP